MGREPNPVERQQAFGFLAGISGGSEDPGDLEAAYAHLAHVMLASTEFLFLN